MKRFTFGFAGTIALCAVGCCDIRIPGATVSQLTNPDWVWSATSPRDRARAEVCMKFPECSFESAEEESQFNDAVRTINQLGAVLPSELERGNISPGEYVELCLLLEFFATELLSYCEDRPVPTDERTRPALDAARARLNLPASPAVATKRTPGAIRADLRTLEQKLD